MNVFHIALKFTSPTEDEKKYVLRIDPYGRPFSDKQLFGHLFHVIFFALLKIFQGNMERQLVVFHKFRPSLKTRYVRVHPRTWYSWIAMRFELYGCRLGRLLVNIGLKQTDQLRVI